MPTLDDAPTDQVAALTGAGAGTAADVASRLHGDDFLQVYDKSEQVAKKITLTELAAALDGAVLDT